MKIEVNETARYDKAFQFLSRELLEEDNEDMIRTIIIEYPDFNYFTKLVSMIGHHMQIDNSKEYGINKIAVNPQLQKNYKNAHEYIKKFKVSTPCPLDFASAAAMIIDDVGKVQTEEQKIYSEEHPSAKKKYFASEQFLPKTASMDQLLVNAARGNAPIDVDPIQVLEGVAKMYYKNDKTLPI